MRECGVETIDFCLKTITIGKLLSRFFSLFRIVRNKRVKIIATYFECSDLLGTFVGIFAGVPSIVSNRRDMGHLLHSKYDIYYKILNRYFKVIVTVSNAVKNRVITFQKVNPEKVLTIYNGVDCARFIGG